MTFDVEPGFEFACETEVFPVDDPLFTAVGLLRFAREATLLLLLCISMFSADVTC